MNLKNGYKVLYEVIEDSKRVFKASTTGLFKDAEEIVSYDIGAFKVVYQRGNEFFGIDAEGNELRLEAFDKIFVETSSEEDVVTPTNVEEPVAPVNEPEIPAEPEKNEEEEIPEDTEEV